MSDEILKEVSRKLDIIVRLLIEKSINDKNKIEATQFLSDIGLSNNEIAKILNIKPNVVRARLSEAKKQNK